MELKYSILIPVYNSENSLEILVQEIESYFNSKATYEIVLVDDFSKDSSWNIIEGLCKKHPFIKGVKLNCNVGQQMALYIGLENCSGTYAITMDDDLQHDVRDVSRLLEKADQGCDLVFGIYDAYGARGIRLWGSKLIGSFFKSNFKNLQGNRVSSFRLIHESVYNKMPKHRSDFVYLSASLLPYAQKVGNATVNRRDRVYGTSGYTFIKCLKIALKLHVYYGGYPWKLVRGVKSDETHSNGWSGELPSKWH